MEIVQYYLNTISNSVAKIGPIVGFILVGYFLFLKVPFFFMLRNMKRSKKELELEQKKRTFSQGSQAGQVEVSAEALFEIRPGTPISKEDLKKKYYELLKKNHPDRVAALDPEFKRLADKKTKEINSAYAKLLKRAA